jgi:FKBP-type peptidyl-prolyl cis-trans isomerase FkpA
MKHTLLALILTLFISCGDDTKKEEPVDFLEANETEILAYIEANNLNAQKSDTGLYYVINEQGSGTQPSANSTVTVAYKGYYPNGNVFDQSDTNGISFGLQQVIKGWTEGITYFNEGGNGVLLVPSHLGYGSFDTRGIPGGSVLIFDVALIAVE